MPYKPDNEVLYCPMHFINTTKKPNVVFLDGSVVNQIMLVNGEGNWQGRVDCCWT
jgi:prepilin-type processing-associated H-X9-DG protein